PQRLLAAARAEAPEASALQDSARELADRVLVLDDQDGLARRAIGSLGRVPYGAGPLERLGQPRADLAPLARRGPDVRLAAALRDGPVHGRQAETRSGALGLGGEERLKGVGGDVGLHALAVVAHRQKDVGAGRERRGGWSGAAGGSDRRGGV